MSYEPLHHKYRPKSFAELVGQEAIATTLTNAIASAKIAPAYLFTGPRGTGKTSSARILAKSLNCLKGDKPTAAPCGICDVCQGITKGYSTDVIEIDAASNTGVDNIRELIERAQFAPMQCRYKVYVIDECLTGDTLVLTNEGLIRIDDPNIKGSKVLSYNDSLEKWEFKQVVRWLDQGQRQTLVIKTTNREIRCTGNHLIRTDQGWIPAKAVKEGVKILSPANVDAALSFTNLVSMDAPGDLLADTSLKAIPTGKKPTTLNLSLNKLNYSDLSVLADVGKSLMSPTVYKKKVKESSVSSLAGKNTHTKKDTEFGNLEQKNSLAMLPLYSQIHWDLSTEHYWEMVPSLTPINTADSLDCVGHTQKHSKHGWNTKPVVFKNYVPSYGLQLIKDTGKYQLPVTQPAIPNLRMFLTSLNRLGRKKLFLQTGLIELPQKDLLGGFMTMALSVSVQKEVPKFNYIQRDSQRQKINSLPVGLQQWDTQQQLSFIPEVLQARNTTIYGWEQAPVENGWQTSNNIPSPQWITSLEVVESVHLGGVEQVYDIEVEDNHNFVANELLVHNCHMLSTQAFNALLKTLEEPPKHVVFVLATTDPQRVLPTIISRCQRFDFRRIQIEAMVKHLSAIANIENIQIAAEAVTLIAQISQGGLRDAESLLDQLALLSGEVSPDSVWDLVGSVSERDLLELLGAIAQDNAEIVLDYTRKILDRGREPITILQNLAGFYRDLLIAKTAPNRHDLVACTQQTWKALVELAQKLDIRIILAGQQHLRTAEVQIKNTTQPRLWLEVTLLGLLPSATNIQPQAPNVSQRVSTPAVSSSYSPAVAQNHQVFAPPTNHNSPAVTQNHQVFAPPTNHNLAANSVSPPTSEPVIEPVTPAVVGEAQYDLTQIWQQVLNCLVNPGSRALFKEHGRLLIISDGAAQVGIPPKLVKLAQPKSAELDAAFERVYQQKVKVTLVQNQSQTAPVNESKVVSSQNSTQIQQPATPSYERQNPPLTPQPAPQQQQPPAPAKIEPVATNTGMVQTLPPPQQPQRPLHDYQSNEIEEAAKRLASFFDGQIIRFSGDAVDYSDTVILPESVYESEIDEDL